MRNCDVLEEAIDEHCSFDSQAVENFTRAMTQNGLDYTIGMWVKSTGLESLFSSGPGNPMR